MVCVDLDHPGYEAMPRDGVTFRAADVADAVAAALDAPFEEHEAVNVAAAENYRGRPTVELFEAAFGRVPDECALEGTASAHSTARAADLLGWEPTRDWREAAEASVPEPRLVA